MEILEIRTMLAVDVGRGDHGSWEADGNGLVAVQAALSPEEPVGNSRNSDSAAGVSVQAGIPDFEVSAAPRVVDTPSLAASPDTVSSEQTAIYAAGLGTVRDREAMFGQRYAYYLKQVARLCNPDGGVRYSSRPGDVDEHPANRSVTLESVAGTVWSSFVASRLNPFVVPVPTARWSATITGIGDDQVLEIGYGSRR